MNSSDLQLQVGQQFAQTPSEDKLYSRGKSMLHNLDLQKYEKNFRKGMLTDSTLSLLNDRLRTHQFRSLCKTFI